MAIKNAKPHVNNFVAIHKDYSCGGTKINRIVEFSLYAL